MTTTRLRNSLQSGLANQSMRAQAVQNMLFQEITRELNRGVLPEVFEIGGIRVLRATLQRVYWGKGAPDEIQTALWLTSRYGLVSASTMPSYCNNNLGLDCGGFVAIYWGIGKPTSGNKQPTGWSGFKPRTIWDIHRSLRRTNANAIDVDDAVICFKNVKNNNPDLAKTKDGAGSAAFHIALVSEVAPVNFVDTIRLSIAESSGAQRSDGGTGVNEWEISRITLKSAGGLVYHEVSATERWYFVAPAGGPTPYEAETYAIA